MRLEGSVRQVRVGVSSGYLAEKTDDRRRREHGWIVVRLYEQVDRVVESGIGSMQGPARPSGGRRKISTAQEMFGSEVGVYVYVYAVRSDLSIEQRAESATG